MFPRGDSQLLFAALRGAVLNFPGSLSSTSGIPASLVEVKAVHNESGCLLCRIMRAAPKVAHSKTRPPDAAPTKVLRHPTVSARPKTLKSWDEGSMQQAMDAVRDRRCTIREAAVTYEVPKSTLGDRISGRVQMGVKSGPPTYLTPMKKGSWLTSLLVVLRSVLHALGARLCLLFGLQWSKKGGKMLQLLVVGGIHLCDDTPS